MKKAALSQFKFYVGIAPLFVFALALMFQACGDDSDVPCGDLQFAITSNACGNAAVQLRCGQPLQFTFDATAPAPASNCRLSNCKLCDPASGCVNDSYFIRTNNEVQCRNAAAANICGPAATYDTATGLCNLGPCEICSCLNVNSANTEAECRGYANTFNCFQFTPTIGPNPPPFTPPVPQFAFDPSTGSCQLGPTPPPNFPDRGCARCDLPDDVF